jgi:hypothetical protein
MAMPSRRTPDSLSGHERRSRAGHPAGAAAARWPFREARHPGLDFFRRRQDHRHRLQWMAPTRQMPASACARSIRRCGSIPASTSPRVLEKLLLPRQRRPARLYADVIVLGPNYLRIVRIRRSMSRSATRARHWASNTNGGPKPSSRRSRSNGSSGTKPPPRSGQGLTFRRRNPPSARSLRGEACEVGRRGEGRAPDRHHPAAADRVRGGHVSAPCHRRSHRSA